MARVRTVRPLQMRPALAGLLAALLAALVLAVPAAAADENADLSLIPPAVQQPAAAPSPPETPALTTATRKVFVEAAFTANAWRNALAVPPPPQPEPPTQRRLSLDARDSLALGSSTRLVFSGRFNVFGERDIPFPSEHTTRLDFREGYLSWQPGASTYLDAGRINLKSGVAVGFNPTDFFRPRTVLDRTSVDPSLLRENRLGTLMVRAQHIWAGGALTLAAAPALRRPTPLVATQALPRWNALWDRTNASPRVLLKANLDLAPGLSPELLLFRDERQNRVGLNVSYGLGQAVIVYAEWAGGRRRTLIADALDYGERTGTFPPGTRSALPTDAGLAFRQDAAVGASLATASKLTLYLEYDYHEAGLSRQDWQRWFDTGRANPGSLPVVGQLWYLRAYASDQLEPLAQRSVFLRASWTGAFTPDLDLSALTVLNPYDHSTLSQVQGDYYASSRWTLSVIGQYNSGRALSERGSLPALGSLVAKAVRYF